MKQESNSKFSKTRSFVAQQKVRKCRIEQILTGPTAIAFGNEDAVAPAKILNDFAKKNEALKLKGGIVEGKVVSQEEIQATCGTSVP